MADKVNVYFPSLAEETLPNLGSVFAKIRKDEVLRKWVKLWFNHRAYYGVQRGSKWLQQLRDKDFIDENVEIDGSLQYYEWRNGTVNYLEDCLKALLARHRRYGTEFAVYGITPDKNDRLITFVDALQDPKLPDEFVKIKCVNTLDELQQYCDARISLENLIQDGAPSKARHELVG